MKLVPAVVLAITWGATALASNYPSDYCYQRVRVKSEGPALIAYVGGGCGSAYVIGYKNGNMLSNLNPDHIDAVVKLDCGVMSKTFVVNLGREWHGNGYLSTALSSSDFTPWDCYNRTIDISIAFSAENQWDSRYSQNYVHVNPGLYNNTTNVTEFNTNEGPGQGSINLKAWDFINSQMKN